MSKMYGTLVSDKGVSTRAGHSFIKAVAQSYEGSVAVSIDTGSDGKGSGRVRIYVAKGSSVAGKLLLEVPLEKLLSATGLSIKRGEKIGQNNL